MLGTSLISWVVLPPQVFASFVVLINGLRVPPTVTVPYYLRLLQNCAAHRSRWDRYTQKALNYAKAVSWLTSILLPLAHIFTSGLEVKLLGNPPSVAVRLGASQMENVGLCLP